MSTVQASSTSLCSSSSLPSIFTAVSKGDRGSNRSALSISTTASSSTVSGTAKVGASGSSLISSSNHRPPTPPTSPVFPPPPSQPLPSPPIEASMRNIVPNADSILNEQVSRKHVASMPVQSSVASINGRFKRLSLNPINTKLSPPLSKIFNPNEDSPVSLNGPDSPISTVKAVLDQVSSCSSEQEPVESTDSSKKSNGGQEGAVDVSIDTVKSSESSPEPTSGSTTLNAFPLNQAEVSIAGTETRVELGSPIVPSTSLTKKSSNFLKKVGLMPNYSSVSSYHSDEQEQAIFSVRQGKRLFTVYKVLIKANANQQWTVYKRYSEFDALDRQLQKHFPLLHKNLPELPPKRYFWDNMSSDFIQNRASGLHRYIQHIFSSPVLLRSKPVREFLMGSSNGNISSITAPLSLVDKLSDSDEVCQNENSEEEQFITAQTRPDAVFSTSDLPSAPKAPKSALRKPDVGISKTLKRVGWRRTMFDYKQPPVVFTQKIVPNNVPTTSTMFYSHKQEEKNESSLSISASSDAGARVSIDDFNLLKIIGKGNFGKVMLAQHKDLQQVFAIKVISKNAIKKKSAKHGNRPSREVDHIMAERNVLVRSVRHPFLIGLKWAFQTTEKLYFVTDYVNGGELFFHLQKERKFSELRARFYAAEIVSALEYLHVEVDVVYRDLKPENILLDSEGHIKLTDFGLAKEHFHRQNRGRTSTFCGTPEYLAPEVLRKEPYGFPVDWWCLGSVLYEMLVGLPPFYSKDVQEMYDKILNEKLRFPSQITLRARSIISGLLHRSPYFRLGTGPNNTSNPSSVKSHPFFEGLDWQRLYRREYTPPFVPTVSHLYDLRNIDPQFVNEPIPSSVLEDGLLNNTTQQPTSANSGRMPNFEIEVSGISTASTNPQNPWTFKGFTFVGEDDWLQPSDLSDD